MCKISVCDALCGSGKTSACINMINKTPIDSSTRYLFVTEFLSEVDRIMDSCKGKDFKTPEVSLATNPESIQQQPNKQPTKLRSLHSLIRANSNIATTHSLLGLFIDETKSLLKASGNYVLILDETIGVVEDTKLTKSEVALLCAVNLNKKKAYADPDHIIDDFNRQLASRTLIDTRDDVVFWSLQKDTFDCFKEVYILTYMFDAQPLRQFLNIWNIKYKYIGTRKISDDHYEFCKASEMDRRRDLRDKIHILDDLKLNEIGEPRNALSYSWYSNFKSRSAAKDYDTVRKNLINVLRNRYHARSGEMMWTVYKQFCDKVTNISYGLSSSFVPFNKRASNEYGNRKYLAYLVNVFWRPWEQRYYMSKGIEFNNSKHPPDMYALSYLIQWMFRSAIRNDKEIWIYIPSERMRYLLKEWIQNLYEGQDLKPVKYTVKSCTSKKSSDLVKRKEADSKKKICSTSEEKELVMTDSTSNLSHNQKDKEKEKNKIRSISYYKRKKLLKK